MVYRVAFCLLITLIILSLPAQAGIGRLTPEMAKRMGGTMHNPSAPAPGHSATAANPAANHGSNSITAPGASTSPDATQQASTPDSGHSNVGLFLFLAVLVLGGTGAGVFLWMRKQQS